MKDTDNALESGLAIVANGDTHAAIASGQYVYVKNHSTLAEGMYTASEAIPTDDPLTTSNLTTVDRGGLNSVNSNFEKFHTVLTTTTSDTASYIRVGSFTLPTNGFWVVSVFSEWASGKPLGLHIAENDTTTDNPKWSSENDVGSQQITLCIAPGYNRTLTVFTKGGSTKNVHVYAYKLPW